MTSRSADFPSSTTNTFRTPAKVTIADAGTSGAPSAAKNLARSPGNIYGPATNLVAMGDKVGGAAHENRQPYLAVNFIIAVNGVFPARPQ